MFQSAFKAILQYIPPTVSANYKYLKYAQSWLGDEIFLAFLPVTGNSRNPKIDSQLLVLVPVKDSSRFQEIIEKFSAQQTGFTQREYKGVTIVEWETSTVNPFSPPPLPEAPTINLVKPPSIQQSKSKFKRHKMAIAYLSGHLAVGTNAQVLEQLIDVKDGNHPVLANEPQYQRANQDSPPATTLVKLYENPVAYITFLRAVTQDPRLAIPSSVFDGINLDQLKLAGGIRGLVFIQPEGLRMRLNAYPEPGLKFNPIISASDTIFPRMPGATYSALIDKNLNLQWQLFSHAISTQPKLKEYLTSFRSYIQTTTKLDLDKDIFSWMDGDYGFFLYPTKGGLFKLVGQSIGTNLNLGIGMVIQTNHRQTAETTFNKLDELIKSFSEQAIGVSNHNLKGQSVTSWDLEGKSSQSLLAYTWVDDKTVMITTGFGAISDLVPEPTLKLPSTYNFQTATKTLPTPSNSYFYVNMGSSMSWIYGMIPNQYKDNLYFKIFQQSIGSIYSISAADSSNKDKIQLDVLTVLAPTRKPLSSGF